MDEYLPKKIKTIMMSYVFFFLSFTNKAMLEVSKIVYTLTSLNLMEDIFKTAIYLQKMQSIMSSTCQNMGPVFISYFF